MSADPMSPLNRALLKLQGELEPVRKDSANPAFKSRYASLGAVWSAVVPHLQAADLYLVQLPYDAGEGRIGIRTRITHAVSGEQIESELAVPVDASGRNGAQAVGSAISYARRYAISCMLGIVTEDDDGHAAGPAPGHRPQAAPRQMTKPVQPPQASNPEAEIVLDLQRTLHAAYRADMPGAAEYVIIERVRAIPATVDALNAELDRHNSELAARAADRGKA